MLKKKTLIELVFILNFADIKNSDSPNYNVDA